MFPTDNQSKQPKENRKMSKAPKTRPAKHAAKVVGKTLAVIAGLAFLLVTTGLAQSKAFADSQASLSDLTPEAQSIAQQFVKHQLKTHEATGGWDESFTPKTDGMETCVKAPTSSYILYVMKQGDRYFNTVIKTDDGKRLVVDTNSDRNQTVLWVLCTTGEVTAVKFEPTPQPFNPFAMFFPSGPQV